MILAIMTRGRVGRQETLKWIPSKYLRDTYLVCPMGEIGGHLEHNSANLAPVPPYIDNYSKKFQYIYDGCVFGGEKKVVVMDDDLYFNEYIDGRLCVIKDPIRLLPMFELIEQLLDTYALVGVHPRMMANTAKPPFQENSKIVTIQGINRAIATKGLKLDHSPILADVWLNCELLARGHANARITTHFVDWLPSQSSGGCDYRTPEMQREATALIARAFHPYAEQVVKRPKTAKWLGDERYDLRVRWKDLYAHGRSKEAPDLLDRGAVEGTGTQGLRS
jgi:hypothetical protein